MIKTSIICPSFNRASFLEACIAPVMDIPDAEFILVDDGSTDGTLELARALQDRYGVERIVVISLEGNQGAQVARNRGMEQARGDTILFCDSDDVLVASGVKELAEALNLNPDLDYAYGQVVMTDENLKPLDNSSPLGAPFLDIPAEYAGWHWHTMGPLYRKNFLKKVGPWNPALTGSQDWEYQARVKLAGGRGLFIDTLVGFWRQHEGGRVGTKKFRPDYVRSVADACAVILHGAQKIDQCDYLLERRIGKKLILHALEAGANNFQSIKDYCLEAGIKTIQYDYLMKNYLKILCYTPLMLDYYLYNIINRYRA